MRDRDRRRPTLLRRGDQSLVFFVLRPLGFVHVIPCANGVAGCAVRLVLRAGLGFPGEKCADIARHTARKVQYLNAEPESSGLQVLFPELEELSCDALQRVRPALLRRIDLAAAIRAQGTRKLPDHDLRRTALGRIVDAPHDQVDEIGRELARQKDLLLVFLFLFCGCALFQLFSGFLPVLPLDDIAHIRGRGQFQPALCPARAVARPRHVPVTPDHSAAPRRSCRVCLAETCDLARSEFPPILVCSEACLRVPWPPMPGSPLSSPGTACPAAPSLNRASTRDRRCFTASGRSPGASTALRTASKTRSRSAESSGRSRGIAARARSSSRRRRRYCSRTISLNRARLSRRLSG